VDFARKQLNDHLDNELSIIPFRFKYLSTLHELLKSNDYLHMSTVTMKTLPKIGYIALLGNHPIAAGFLRRVEGGYAQIDTLTSNKAFGSLIRHQGIKLVVENLLQDAKDLNLHGIIAFSVDDGILDRAETLGFKTLPHSLIALNLSK
jgi:hypothetical protein